MLETRSSGTTPAEETYRGFSREELDREYNAAAFAADTQRHFSRYVTKSEMARRKLRCSLDIPYGPSPPEKLDVFYSDRPNAPVHIFFHGGGFRSQDKVNHSFVADSFSQAGYVTVIPNYGLCPSVTLTEAIRQAHASIAWVHENCKAWGADPDRITISGHSAGAAIVAMALYLDWARYSVPNPPFKKAVAISGLYDQEPRRLSYLNEFLRLSKQESLEHTVAYQPPANVVPLIVTVAANETAEYRRQSRDYAAMLISNGYPAQFHEFAGFNHYDIIDAIVDRSTGPGSLLFDFIAT